MEHDRATQKGPAGRRLIITALSLPARRGEVQRRGASSCVSRRLHFTMVQNYESKRFEETSQRKSTDLIELKLRFREKQGKKIEMFPVLFANENEKLRFAQCSYPI
ncbi:hypothetical protein TNCV_1967641 [Trichonephila clavipes]|nr:hypothetical protein TNCV_1967641 [Trichonephila clavipes]